MSKKAKTQQKSKRRQATGETRQARTSKGGKQPPREPRESGEGLVGGGKEGREEIFK